MIPYLICFILPVIASFLPKKSIKNKKLFIAVLLLPFCILIAFKHKSVGADTMAYNKIFERMYDGTFWYESSYQKMEIGFVGLIWLLTRITAFTQIQYILLSIFFLITFIYFLFDNTEDYALFLLLFYSLNVFSFFLTGLRQSIAILICFWGFNQARKKHFMRFIILVALAFLFHKSSIIFLIVYWCINKQFKKNNIIWYILFFIVIALFNESLFSIGNEIFDANYGIEYVGNGYIMVAIMAIITIMSFFFYMKLVKLNVFNAALIELNVVCMGLWILRLFSRTAERLSLYFMPFTILLVCQLIGMIDRKIDKSIVSIILISLTLFLFIYKLNNLGLTSYRFFWD